jgi:heme-degrading monooxygenase HmoA
VSESVGGAGEFPAATPRPPYYAVIFTNTRTSVDDVGYGAAADRMLQLAARQPGYLGVESARGADGCGITVSYWESLEAIGRWRVDAEHAAVQVLGRERWYANYQLRVARVEAETRFEAGPHGTT